MKASIRITDGLTLVVLAVSLLAGLVVWEQQVVALSLMGLLLWASEQAGRRVIKRQRALIRLLGEQLRQERATVASQGALLARQGVRRG